MDAVTVRPFLPGPHEQLRVQVSRRCLAGFDSTGGKAPPFAVTFALEKQPPFGVGNDCCNARQHYEVMTDL
ncbi:hypothetical protein Brsp01_33240 [Brucella sp. NBRC 12950]|nr:hypothetical protein Brsp01_33240 [Brucella sp. NBRC 12950]